MARVGDFCGNGVTGIARNRRTDFPAGKMRLMCADALRCTLRIAGKIARRRRVNPSMARVARFGTACLRMAPEARFLRSAAVKFLSMAGFAAFDIPFQRGLERKTVEVRRRRILESAAMDRSGRRRRCGVVLELTTTGEERDGKQDDGNAECDGFHSSLTFFHGSIRRIRVRRFHPCCAA